MPHRFLFRTSLTVATLLAVSLVVGCGGNSSPAPDNANADGTGDAAPVVTPPSPNPPAANPPVKTPPSKAAKELAETAELKIGPDELVQAYVKDKRSAGAEYNGKTVEITGRVKNISVTRSSDIHDPAIALERADGAGKKGDELWCVAKNKEPWTEVSIGDEVTIRGLVSISLAEGLWIDPYVLESTSGGPMAKVSAADLTRRFAADAAALQAEFDGKWVLVEGEAASARTSPQNRVSGVNLVGSDGAVLPVEFRHYLSDFAKVKPADWIKPGANLMLVGRVTFKPITPGSDETFGLVEADPVVRPPDAK